MEAERTENPKRSRGVPGLHKGESLIASAGLALAAVLLAGLAGSAWTAGAAIREARVQAEERRLDASMDVLADTTAAFLASGELTALRRAVMTVGEAHDLELCRVTLGDGTVIASTEPRSEITAVELPETWPTVPADAAVSDEPTSLSRSRVVSVGPQRSVILQAEASPPAPGSLAMDTQTSVGLVGAATMAGLLLAYRWYRGRIRAIGMLREALRALGAGERDRNVLQIDPRLGPEVQAWNALLDERASLQSDLESLKANEALSVSRRDGSDLAGACDAMSQGMLVVDEHAKIIFANGAASVYLATPRDQIVGQLISELLPDGNMACAVEGVAGGRARQRQAFELERDVDGASGVLRVHVRPVRRDDSGAAVVFVEDITQQRIADRSRNAFVASATHELRNPLTNIRLYVEEILDDPEGDPVRRSTALNVINQEVRRLERLVGDMLSVAEMEAGALKLRVGDVRLETLFEELEHDYSPQAEEKGIELVFDLPPKLPVIQGDRDKITRALHNLVGNAIKYTPDAGKVTVKVTAEDESEIAVDVTDTGIGIGPDDLPRIFEPFVRVTSDERVANITGTGLGLTIARECMRLHGGEIDVRSELGKGSTFTITVPSKAA